MGEEPVCCALRVIAASLQGRPYMPIREAHGGERGNRLRVGIVARRATTAAAFLRKRVVEVGIIHVLYDPVHSRLDARVPGGPARPLAGVLGEAHGRDLRHDLVLQGRSWGFLGPRLLARLEATAP